MAKRCRLCLLCDKWILWDAYILYQDFILEMHLFHFWGARILCQNFIFELHSALSALSAHSVRWHPTSSHKQVWCYMRSDLLVYVQTPNSLRIRPLRLFKQVIWGDIWQLPQKRNTTDRSDGQDRQEELDRHLILTFRTLVWGSFFAMF